RMSGFSRVAVPAADFRPRHAPVWGRDLRDFPGFYATGHGGFPSQSLASIGFGGEGEDMSVTEYVCTEPLRYTGAGDVQADIDRLKATAGAHGVGAFLPAITP